MNSILETIILHKKQEVIEAKNHTPLSQLQAIPALPIRQFTQALMTHNPAVIAEIKKASPSKGIIRNDFDVALIASQYEQYGASCLSVLTDEHFFKGDKSYLAIAKQQSTLPVLRKDFIIDDYQISESRALGADCILLIVAMLDDHQLMDFCQQAQELHMAVLVESHTREEWQRALLLPTPLMGVNNRSLHTFVTDKAISIELANELPADKLLISESGFNTRDDIMLMQHHGISRFLIGESLMRAENPGEKLAELIT